MSLFSLKLIIPLTRFNFSMLELYDIVFCFFFKALLKNKFKII